MTYHNEAARLAADRVYGSANGVILELMMDQIWYIIVDQLPWEALMDYDFLLCVSDVGDSLRDD